MTMEHCPRQECPSTEAMKIGDYKCRELGIATRAGYAVVECLGCCLIWYQPRGTFPAGANAEPIGFVSADRTKINPVGDRMRTRSDRTTDH
jgi:hypothetical protein